MEVNTFMVVWDSINLSNPGKSENVDLVNKAPGNTLEE